MTKSQASKNSLQSRGIPITLKEKNKNSEPVLVPERPETGDIGDRLFNVTVFLIYCKKHKRIAVRNVDRAHCVFLPYVPLSDTSCWDRSAHDGVKLIIGSQDAEVDAAVLKKLTPEYSLFYLNVLRIQLTNEKFITRITLCVTIEESAFVCCQPNNRVQWVDVKDILANNIPKIWGPEVRNFTQIHSSGTYSDNLFVSFTLQTLAHYYGQCGSWQRNMLLAAGIRMEHIVQVYEDYLEHCYPAFYMSFESFRWYAKKRSYDPNSKEIHQLFQAFSINRLNYLDVFEVLLGLVAIDPSFDISLSEGRIRFVFRYYNTAKNDRLTVDDLTHMISDIFHANDTNPSEEMMNDTLKKAIIDIGMKSDYISLQSFIYSVKSKTFDLTEKLCRAGEQVLMKMVQMKIDNLKSYKTVKLNKPKKRPAAVSDAVKRCLRCRQQKYLYCVHAIKIDTKGRCVEPKILENEPSTNPAEVHEGYELVSRKYSIEMVFGNDCFASIILDMIRDYYFKTQQVGIDAQKKPIGLMADPSEWPVFLKYLSLICESLLGILSAESKVIKVNSPAVVVGDLQGDLYGLLVFENHCFHSIPAIPSNIVFLGNYSGVRLHGIECILFVFCMKILLPNKVFLLRGNHETRVVNKQFLEYECYRKYGESVGQRAFSYLNLVFDRLPLATIIDEKIFCSHSGIPRSIKLSKLNKLPLDIRNPLREAPEAYEILVNKPVGANRCLENLASDAKSWFLGGTCFTSELVPGVKAKASPSPLPVNSTKIPDAPVKEGDAQDVKSPIDKTRSFRPGKLGSLNLLGSQKSCIGIFKSCDNKQVVKKVSKLSPMSSGKSKDADTKSMKNSPQINVLTFKSNKNGANGGRRKGLKEEKTDDPEPKSKSLELFKTFKDTHAGAEAFNVTKHFAQPWQVGYQVQVGGFHPSHERINAFDFDEKALQKFFQINGLTHMIRAQYMPESGYSVQWRQQLFSTFHCSGYLRSVARFFHRGKGRNIVGQSEPINNCSVIFIDKFKHSIHPITFDTTKGRLVEPIKNTGNNENVALDLVENL